MNKIIAFSNYWKCSNMDTLAPIIEEGIEYLLSDSTRILVKDGTEDPRLDNIEFATKEEKMAYARTNYGIIFNGDIVTIKRGRKMVGETKKVVNGFRFYIDGTYGKKYTDYVVFEDGTKVNIDHCDVVGVEYKPLIYRGEEIIYREFGTKNIDLIFQVGGRK